MKGFEKVYEGVTLKISAEGIARPVALEWEDGRQFDIDRVLLVSADRPNTWV